MFPVYGGSREHVARGELADALKEWIADPSVSGAERVARHEHAVKHKDYLVEVDFMFIGAGVRGLRKLAGAPFRATFNPSETCPVCVIVRATRGASPSSGYVPRPSPTGKHNLRQVFVDAMDDLRGGAKTQALTWADTELRRVSEAALTLGVPMHASLEAIYSADRELALAVARANVQAGRAALSQLPPSLGNQCEEYASSFERLFRDAPAEPPNAEYARAVAARIAGGARGMYLEAWEVSRRSRIPADLRAAVGRLREVTWDLFVEPALVSRVIGTDEAFDRPFLPLRLTKGALWSPALDRVLGGVDTLTLAEERERQGLPAPVYVPHVWEIPGVGEAGWLRTDSLYIADATIYLPLFLGALGLT